MSDFKAKNVSNLISDGAPPQTPLGKLTALPRPVCLLLRGGREKSEGRGREGEGKARERGREEKRGEGICWTSGQTASYEPESDTIPCTIKNGTGT